MEAGIFSFKVFIYSCSCLAFFPKLYVKFCEPTCNGILVFLFIIYFFILALSKYEFSYNLVYLDRHSWTILLLTYMALFQR